MTPFRLQNLISWPAFVRCLPFGLFMMVLAMRGALEGRIDTRWLYAMQAGYAAFALVVLGRHYHELRWKSGSQRSDHLRRSLPHLAMSVGMGLIIAVMWVLLDAPWMRIGGSSASFVPTDAAGQLQFALVAIRLTGACLVVPLMEELFWRSFLMRWLDRRDFLRSLPAQASFFAIVGSSAIFALAHDRWLAAFIAGLLFAALYRHTEQIWQAIGAHAVANLSLGAYVIHQRAWSLW